MKNTLLAILLISLLASANSYAQNSGNLTVREVGNDPDPEKGNPYRNFRFTFGGGYAYRLGKLNKTGEKQADDLLGKLRHGYSLDAEAQYFFKEYWGLALNVIFAKQSAGDSGTIYIPGTGSLTDYKEFNRFVYVGPSFVMRFENEKFGFYGGAGYGPLFYTNGGEAVSPRIKGELNKTAFGAYLGISGEYRINPQLGVGLKMAVMGGTVKLSEELDRENVSNLTITGFISFRSK